jgi:hypothetical protein
MKTLARFCSSPRNTRSRPVVAGGRERGSFLMFDSRTPEVSGSLAGESFAATLENHPRYPALNDVRDAALLSRIVSIIEDHFARIGAVELPGLGFDDAGIVLYRSAALSAFRAAMPTPRRES